MKLRSYQFRKEREQSWEELEYLVEKGEKHGLASLSHDDLFRLPILYRAVLSSLSVSRAISLETNVVSYLEGLSSRAYFLLYGVRGKPGAQIWTFLVYTFPEAVRRAFPLILLAAMAMMLGVFTGFYLTNLNPDWFFTFVDQTAASGRTPTASTEELRSTIFNEEESGQGALSIFSTFLFTHNARVGMLAFALGFAFGLPTLILLFINGAMLGAFVALFESRGLGVDFMGWIFVHGSTELLAIILCGAAGLILARAVIFPSNLTRREALFRRGREASVIVIGAVILFLVAGLLEGYARQLVQQTEIRYAIGGTALFIWFVYFVFSGRQGRRKGRHE